METPATQGSGSRVRVEGLEVGGGPIRMAVRRSVLAAFPGQPDEVRRWLPSPALHPVRWLDGRPLVTLTCYDLSVSLKGLPAFRYAEVAAGVSVTHGSSAAPRVLPLLPGGQRWGAGIYYLFYVVTNRVAREVTEGVFGAPASLDAVTSQTGADLLRYSVGDPDQPWLALNVKPSHGARQSAGTTYCYGVRDGSVIRWTQHTAGRGSLGRRGSAHLTLGEHPLADAIGRLTASPHAVSTVVTRTGDLVFDEAVDVLEPALPPDRADTSATDDVETPFLVRDDNGRDEVVDQRLRHLPFDPTATITAVPIAE